MAASELDPTSAPTVDGAVVDRTLELGADDTLAARDPLGPGAAIGDFVVSRVIGAGGMGVVLEAHDPDLDRRVAIKVMHDGRSGAGGSHRLVAEGQAMARLSHPNVVTVHQVGVLPGDRAFLVMELVAGQTLAEWLDERPRRWPAIVAVFRQVAAGLDAAHRAGLIHRDLKPANVLIDRAGRARVSDFGIALLAGQDGAPAGTPAYMAPEQLGEGPIDARADQYAFAVALDEALDGRRPPTRLRRAVARARQADPAARFPSMAELAAELAVVARGPHQRRVALVLAGTAVLAGGVALALARPGATDACTAQGRMVDLAWNPTARAALGRRFVASGRPHADASAAAVSQLVDDYAAAWRLARTGACRARGEVAVRRGACLDRRLAALRGQLAAWHAADGDGVDGAVRAAAGLPSLDACAEPRALPAPTVAALLDRLDQAEVLERGGQLDAAERAVAAILPEVERAGDAGALAEALALAGRLELAAGHHAAAREQLARAALSAGRAADDRSLATALLAQAAATTADGRAGEALGLIGAAEALVARARLDDLDEAVARRRGEALTQAGRVPDAVRELERAVGLAEARSQRAPAGRLTLASDLGVLATAHIMAMRYDLARPLLERTLAIEEDLLGPAHPEVAASLHDLAVTEARLGDTAHARAHYQRARAILVAVHGEDHVAIGKLEVSLGNLEFLVGDLAAAEPHYRAAQALFERNLPADHPEVALIHGNLAALLREADRCPEAIPEYQRAVALADRAGVRGTNLATALTGLGECLTDEGDPTAGRPPLERALAELTLAEVPGRATAEVHAALAEALWPLGERAAARHHGELGAAALAGDDGADVAPLKAYLADWLAHHGAPR